MRKLILTGLFVLGLSCLLASGAKADSFDLGAIAATPVTEWVTKSNLTTSGGTSGTFTLTFTLDNTSSGTVTINSYALQLFNAGPSESFTVTSATLNGSPLSSPWEDFSDTKLNNGSSPTCSG